MYFRRAPHQCKALTQLQTEQVGRWVNEAKSPIKRQRSTGVLNFKSQRGNDLKDVARLNMFLATSHDVAKIRLFSIRLRLERRFQRRSIHQPGFRRSL
jgi:hypothetical protein